MPIVLFLFLLLLYINNLSRSVYGGDVGDLVTAAYTLGVPHPPGYPLFTFLGFIISRFSDFFSQTPAFMIGLISAFSGAAGVAVYYIFSYQLTKNKLLSAIASLTLSFTFLYWFYNEIAEVFALNNFFALLIILLAYLYRERKSAPYLYFLALTVGLSATNHHTIVFVFPAVLILIWSQFLVVIKKHRRQLLLAALCGVMGFSIYIYPVIASQTKPLIDWGNIHNLQSFLDLLLRKKYGTFDLAVGHVVTPTARLVVLKTYATTLLTQLTIPVVVLSLFGVISLWRRQRILTIALLFAFLSSGPFFVTYAGFYLTNSFYFGIYERFLSLSTVIFLLYLPSGLLAFTSTLSRFFSRKEYGYLFQGIFLLIPLMLFTYNFPKTDLSDVWVGDTLGANHLTVLPKNSILYLSGDTNLFNTWYMRYARHVRPDVDVYNGLSADITLREYGKAYGITDRKQFLSLVNKLDATHPIFSDRRMSGDGLKGTWIPYGLYYEYRSPLENDLSYEEYLERTESLWKKMNLPTKHESENLAQKNFTIAIIPEMYANALVVTGNYFLSEYRKPQTAEAYYLKAIDVDPEYSKTYATLGAFYLTDQKNCHKAIDSLEKALDLYQFDTRYYYLLYLSYQECKVPKDQLVSLEQAYQQIFQAPITAGIKEYETSETAEAETL